MNWTEPNPDLRFGRRPRPLSHRLIAVGVGLALFTVLWTLVPSGTLFWLLLPILAAVIWAASYGWRQSVAALIAFLARLEHL